MQHESQTMNEQDFDLQDCRIWFWTVNKFLLKAHSFNFLHMLVQKLKCLRASLNGSTRVVPVLSVGLYLSSTHERSAVSERKCSASWKIKCYDSVWLPVSCRFNRSAKYFSSGTNFRTDIDFTSFKSFSSCNYDGTFLFI